MEEIFKRCNFSFVVILVASNVLAWKKEVEITRLRGRLEAEAKESGTYAKDFASAVKGFQDSDIHVESSNAVFRLEDRLYHFGILLSELILAHSISLTSDLGYQPPVEVGRPTGLFKESREILQRRRRRGENALARTHQGLPIVQCAGPPLSCTELSALGSWLSR